MDAFHLIIFNLFHTFRVPLNASVPLIASIVALRPSLEELMGRACEEPEALNEPSEMDQSLLTIVRGACKPGAGSVGVENTQEMSGAR